MGQGYSSVTLPAGPSAMEATELSDLAFEKPLGGARFLRTIRARHQNGIVVVKSCQKANASVSFKKYARLLKEERQKLRDIPNVLPYARIRETSTLGVLVRQYIHNSLYDRISIRPFLEDIEKKWIAFQLLCAVRDCHSRGVFHGDIKSENVLVTSWGWVYLTDFASTFKPVYLPEDNPADFSFYYDTSARRTCYLAPERFLASGERPSEGDIVQWNMDIFSLGCVLAELFTEAPTFTLSQLFRYRKGEYDPTVSLLNKIDDEHVRALISSMIRLDPTERWHASDYLDEYKSKAFPLYFYNHLHTLMQEITDPASGRRSIVARDTNNGETDDRIDRIYDDFEMLSVSLGYADGDSDSAAGPTPLYLRGLFPLQVDLPNRRHTAQNARSSTGDNGTFVLLNVITSSMRSSARASSKVRACELLLAFAEQLPDEAKLDRILPYIMPLLDDSNDMVLVAALRTMTQLLSLVTVVSPVNSFLFTQYIFPRLLTFTKSPGFFKNPLVRATYAACLASLAETATRFLDMMQALRAEGSLPSTDKDADADGFNASGDAYDAARLEMLEQFEGQIKVFLTDTDNAVRRAFLTSVSSLCVFLGETRAADVILTHLNTYLNDPDWLLKCAFFKTIVGVAVYIGAANLEEFILPLMVQSLTDPQEFVVEQTLRSMATMAEMGLLQREKTWELIDNVARFEVHPNIWIKEAASHFIAAATTYLSMADIRIIAAPLIQPYLKIPVGGLDESELLDALKKPLPRAVLDLAAQWAARSERSTFWKGAERSKQLVYPATGHMPPQSSVAAFGPKSLAKEPKTDEDEQWLGRLRNAGMRSEDDMKLLALRAYLLRTAKRARRDDGTANDNLYEQIISLTKMKITPQTVIFDGDLKAYEQHVYNQNRTVAEAIEEASKQLPNTSGSKIVDNSTGDTTTKGDETSEAGIPVPQQLRRLSGLRTKASDSLSSSPSSGLGLLGRDMDQALRQKGNPAGLLGGTDLRGKAHAEVKTDGVTAAGRLDSGRSVSRRASPRPNTVERRKELERAASHRAVHNYAGNDPTVLKLLDTLYVDNFPAEAADFGPMVQPCSGTIPTNASVPTPGPWRPQGQLLGVLAEHTAKLTRIVPSPDHVFFLTASDDGAVKVWDTSRLERNVTHRSRQTYRLAEGVKVTSLCFVEATHSFVCTGSDGSVHVVRVDVAESNNATRYGRLRMVREWHIPTRNEKGEHAVWAEHYRGDSASTLVLATNLGRILAVDLRYMSLLFDLQNPANHGTPSSFCIGRRHDWLVVGTCHGVLDLWDMRFQVRVRSWTFTNPAPITRVQLLPGRKSRTRNRFCITGGTAPGDVSVWEPEKGVCYEVYRSAHANSKDRLHARDYEFRNVEDEKAEGLLGRAAGSIGTDQGEVEQNSDLPQLASCSFFGAQPAPKDQDSTIAFAITGGPDNKVRFWDCDRLDGCRHVSGGSPDTKTSYMISQLSQDTRVISEKPAESSSSTDVVESNKVAPNSSAKRNTAANAVKPPSRYETIRMSAQNLMSAHLDIITDVALVERPFGMVLSADRSGQVFVHQ
ncbi:Putative serine/threonine-protein kinase [Fulvia fulva]|nr:putative serine/threonine-protein kinase [Fulvia fulva]WPV18137.1 Putative serine/threonine-protein kinase [Fulvia fulva]WPV33133.1 Putative serine/threonine-protein kinase [Fulvia fulva]